MLVMALLTRLSVMSPKTMHMRGSTTPLATAITVPMKIIRMSHLSANLNCTRNRDIRGPAGGRYLKTAGDRRSEAEQQEDVMHSHPISSFPSNCTFHTLSCYACKSTPHAASALTRVFMSFISLYSQKLDFYCFPFTHTLFNRQEIKTE